MVFSHNHYLLSIIIYYQYGLTSNSWTRRGITNGCQYRSDLQASREYQSLTNCPTSKPIPVEQGGGLGTACSHWDELCFASEVMSGFVTGSTMSLSRMTVGAMADLGYQVNYAAADDFAPSQVHPSCACGGRELGVSSSYQPVAHDDAGQRAAFQWGNQVLDEATAGKPAASRMRGARYVGNEFVSVLYQDEQGQLRGLSLNRA